MKTESLVLAGGIAVFVGALTLFFKTAPGKKIGKYWPLPFWVYFLSISLAQLKILPASSDFYPFAGSHVLAAAIFLMLVGAPVRELVRMGRLAFTAMMVAAGSIFVSAIGCYALFRPVLPEEGWKAVGALVGTWIGGSANMLAVKEIVGLSDAGLAPLILVDTILSYTWLALLFLGAGLQAFFDRGAPAFQFQNISIGEKGEGLRASVPIKIGQTLGVVSIGLAFSNILVTLGRMLSSHISFLSPTAWVLLLASIFAVGLSLTPLRSLEVWGASRAGSFLLYMVLVTIGAKSQMGDVRATPVYLFYGAVLLMIHGVILFGVGWIRKWPLFLLATASQANVGGPVSAPIVANAYKPGTASIGVLMAIFGALMGTYMGVLASWICKKMAGV